MKKQSKILLFEVIFYIALIMLTYYLSHYIYADAYKMDFAIVPLTSLVVVTLVNWKKEVKFLRFRWDTYVIICIVIAVFLVTRPKYTYEQAKGLLKDRGYETIESLEDKSLLSFELSRTHFYPVAYLYTGKKNGEKYYLQVHPKFGEIDSLKVGEGNYIDNYLKLKKEKVNSSTPVHRDSPRGKR